MHKKLTPSHRGKSASEPNFGLPVGMKFERGREPNPSLLKHFKGHRDSINSIYFHPNLQQVISCSSDGHIMNWNFKTASRALRFEGHEAAVNDVAFSKHGDLMVSGSDDNTVRVWVPIISGEVRSFRAHHAPVRSVAFNPVTAGQIVSVSDDKTIKLWSIEHTPLNAPKVRFRSHTFIKSYNCHKNWVRSARYHPEGNLLCTASDDNTVGLFDIRQKEQGLSISVDLGCPVYAEFNPTACNYVGVCTTKNFLIYDIRKGALTQCYDDIHKDTITKFSFHPSGDFAITVSEDATIKILDVVEGRPIFTLYGPSTGLHAVSCSQQGDLFATGGKDKDLLIWQPTLIPYFEQEVNVTLKASESDLKRNRDRDNRTPTARASTSGTKSNLKERQVQQNKE